jgi:RinA family phage transcriptional activator
MTAVATKARNKAAFAHVEAELYMYHETLKEIERIREDILYGKEIDENVGGGRGNLPSSPTERKTIAIVTHRRLQQLEQIADAIKTVYESLPEEKKRLIQLKYWTKPQRYTWEGIAEQLHISERQARRWRNEIVYAIMDFLGWR